MNPFSSHSWSKRKRRKSAKQRKQQRHLQPETLEQRQMLAADAFFHNHYHPEDVNDDGVVSVIDALSVINAMTRPDPSSIDQFTDVDNDGRQSARDALMVINRLNRPDQEPTDYQLGQRDQGPRPLPPVPEQRREFQSIDGTGNHLENPQWGSAGENLLRVAEAQYADGISEPAGSDRPSTREISNLLSAIEAEGQVSQRDLSAFVYVWGQFLDHDIDLSGNPGNPADYELFNIQVPTGDAWFDPTGTGEAEIPLIRSDYDPETGTSVDNPRQQMNAITSFIDGSQIYGSDAATLELLREFEGGRMLIRDNGLPPLDEDGNILAGDIRAAENPSLTAMHALFLREHNRMAEHIARQHEGWNDEQIFQHARLMVIAELQHITYHEYLPALLGRRAITRYEGYDSSVNPGIATEFSTAAFRFGHSTLNDDVEFFGNDGRAVSEELSLAEAFFNTAVLEENGIGSVLKYDASSLSQEIDLEVVDSLRNFLFGPPGAGGLDLVALNIQRGRDHGLADYNSTRVAYGLPAYESFADLTSNLELQEKLATLYGDVNHIDLWVGLMAEDHVPGASVGQLTQTIIAEQFQRLRDGDRFYYENVFEGEQLHRIRSTSLADIIQRNTEVRGLQDNVFFFRAEVRGQVTTLDLIRDQELLGDRPLRDRPASDGVAGVPVELLDEDGNVIASTTTDMRGNYRFRQFNETGDYQIRLAETGDTIDVLIRTGDMQLRELDFVLV